MATQDSSSSNILSFLNSLSEKFDVLKAEVENLKKPNPSNETTPHNNVDTTSNESSDDSPPNPPRPRSRQTRRDRQKQKRDRRSWSNVLLTQMRRRCKMQKFWKSWRRLSSFCRKNPHRVCLTVYR